MINFFKKNFAKGKKSLRICNPEIGSDNVGWGLSLRDLHITRRRRGRLGKKSINNCPCHPELVSGSGHQQKCSANCSQKSNVGVETPTYFNFSRNVEQVCQTDSNISLNTNKRGIIVQCFRQHSPRRAAFTLAEVLITLGIIGVVAAMTLPTLIAKYQEKVTVTKLKKVYSILSQAYLRAQEDYGTIDNWGFQEDAESTISPDGGWTVNDSFYSNSDTFINVLSKYMNAQTKCVSTNPKCTGYRQGATYFLSGIQSSPASNSKDTSAYIILNDGIVISGAWINRNNPLCTDKKNAYCGNFSVDINGADGPNTLGKDIFYFKINKKGIYPHGGPDDDSTHSFPANCNLTSTANSNGYGCTAWVIHNENMDYLHCDDLSWNGKHKCK